MKNNAIICLLSVGVLSCGSAHQKTTQKEALTVNETSMTNMAETNRDTLPDKYEKTVVEITQVHRSELKKIIAAGPANLLAMVQIDSYKKNGKFVGFKIVSFRNDASVILGLTAGDVVVKVNEMSIERPEQYFEVFEKLKTAEKLSFQIIRNGDPLIINHPILPE